MGKPVQLGAAPYYHEIREAFGQPGCPLCRLLARSADRYLDAVLWEQVNDIGVRSELNQARGYCPQHGWLLVRAGAALGVAILTRGVVKTLLDVLASNPIQDEAESVFQSLRRSLDRDLASRPAARLVAELSPQRPCPVCSLLESKEEDYISTLVAHLDGPGSLADAYRTSDGLCLPHFRRTLARAPSGAEARLLSAAQQAVWQRLHDDLGEFIRKSDYRFRGEPFGDEKDAWLQALEAISGPPPRSRSEGHSLTESRS
jgi:hypothetical protein